MTVDAYAYTLPEELIAQEPASPRDAARLFVYDRCTKRHYYDTFAHLGAYLPPASVIVLNATRVVPARLWCRKQTGGKVQVLYIRHDDSFVYARCDRRLAVGSQVFFGKRYSFTVHSHDGMLYVLRPSFAVSRTLAMLQKYGTTPIPPYIKHSPLSETQLRRRYQTIVADKRGSVAAPTASLHMTQRLMRSLKAQGHTICTVTLHVGLGTFAPLTPEHMRTGQLHEERYWISPSTRATLTKAKNDGRPIVAVGTTVARTLESATDEKGNLVRPQGSTTIFIRPRYQWKFVDHLITNFHVPKSSLMMLVASLVGRVQLLRLYRDAISRRFRFYSFGDGMLIR